MAAPKLIVMFTNHDLTTPDAIELFEGCKDAPAEYWGFKDVGMPYEFLEELHKHMKDAGKTTFVEIVKETREEIIESLKFAARIKADYVLHTKYDPEYKAILDEGGVRYMPSLGKHVDHKLTGTVEAMVKEAQDLADAGVYGFKLSAYRYIEGDPAELMEGVMSVKGCHTAVTGSINDDARLDSLLKNNVEMFTIGGAFYNKKFGETFAEQITYVHNYLNK